MIDISAQGQCFFLGHPSTCPNLSPVRMTESIAMCSLHPPSSSASSGYANPHHVTGYRPCLHCRLALSWLPRARATRIHAHQDKAWPLGCSRWAFHVTPNGLRRCSP